MAGHGINYTRGSMSGDWESSIRIFEQQMICSLFLLRLPCASRISTVDEVLIHQRVNVRTSLSRTREKSWDCFYIALLAMQKELKDRGLYDTLERAFVNWALNFSLWQLNTMTGSAYEKTYRLLKRKGFDRLDISRHNRRYFYSNKEYDKFLKIYTTPYEKSSGY